MRVVFLTHYSKLLGANKSLLDIITGVKSHIEAFVLLPEKGPLSDVLSKLNIPWQVVPIEAHVYQSNINTELKRPIRILRRSFKTQKVIAAIKFLNPDVIYTNSSVINDGIIAAQKLKKPHVWHIREYGKDDYNLSFDFGLKGLKCFMKKSDIVITISNSIDNHIKNIAPRQATIQIYDGIINQKSIVTHPKDITLNNEITFTIAGYISENKGQFIAIEALKLVRNEANTIRLRLLIVGEGDPNYVKELKEYVSENKMDDIVSFVGFTNNMNMYYAKTDILLMCSKKEALGRVTVEAMANGIPVIGTNSGGTIELITHNENGVLFERNPIKLKEAIQSLLNDKSLYTTLSKKAIEKAQTFTIEKNATTILEILHHLV
jgi:glycosyltransferase involved in cell wall biosynthesis